MKKLANYINGADVTPVSNQYIDNFNPSTGAVYSLIPDSDERDVELAYQSAEKAFEIWSKTPAEKRFKILNRIAELIDLKNDELALAESIDQGKPVWLAKTEMTRSAQNFRFFATAAMQFNSESHNMEGHAINYTIKSRFI